jgi:hypothetical protein
LQIFGRCASHTHPTFDRDYPGRHSRISDQAQALYQALGFDPSPGEPMTLMVTLADIRLLLS